MIDLFQGYNHLIRPMASNSSRSIQIDFSLAMILLINIDEKNQIMQTNVWLTMKWIDHQLRWDPMKYGNIRTIRVPPSKVWLPDIVLFNNADGNYEVSFYSNVVIEYTGQMLWVPPAIYKSSCTIDVEFFPFDEQTCAMIFGSWTFNEDEVTIDYLEGKRQVELNDYSPSGIWDILEVPGQLILNKSKIAYHIKIRRKTLFYTVILIIPTVLMALLSMMVFYLSAEASEKITLAISLLLALVVFLLLVSKILPPTSSTIPLMAKYLLLTFIINVAVIAVTVVVINVYFRSPITHRMSPWMRTIFLDQLPLFLLMKRPHHKVKGSIKHAASSTMANEFNNGQSINNGNAIEQSFKPGQFIEMSHIRVHHPYCHLKEKQQRNGIDGIAKIGQKLVDNDDNDEMKKLVSKVVINDEALKAIEAIEYITEYLRHEDRHKKIRDDWKYISMVIDRLLLYAFFAVTLGGTLSILFSAPNVFEYVDQDAVIAKLQAVSEAQI